MTMKIQVLGTGCSKCVKTAAVIEEIAVKQGVEVEVVKETSPEVMMEYGVMSTPAVAVDGELVHSGSIPHSEQIIQWLTAV